MQLLSTTLVLYCIFLNLVHIPFVLCLCPVGLSPQVCENYQHIILFHHHITSYQHTLSKNTINTSCYHRYPHHHHYHHLPPLRRTFITILTTIATTTTTTITPSVAGQSGKAGYSGDSNSAQHALLNGLVPS